MEPAAQAGLLRGRGPGCSSGDHVGQWGFILTGPDTGQDWPLQRPPFLLETTTPGVFAVGDVRHGSMKRVASAVGDGSTAIRLIHDYLARALPVREGQ
jgi:thioredoxin reductase